MNYKLIIFDMDGVIFQHDNFWFLLHKTYKTYEEGKELTKKYLQTDYARLVEEVVNRLWKGKPAKPYYDLIKKAKYNKGVKETFRTVTNLGLKTAIISSGPSDLALRAKKDLKINYLLTNKLVIKDKKITGKFVWPIAEGHDKKVKALKKICKEAKVKLKDCIAVLDDKNDVELAKAVGYSISFNSSSKKLDIAADKVIRIRDLTKVLKEIQREVSV